MRTRIVLATSGAAVAVGLLGIAGAAAQIIGVPDVVEIGTTSSDHPNGLVAAAFGGCASGTVAVGISGCRPEGTVSIGLGGSGARGDIVIADSGDAETSECAFLCVPPHVAVTGGGGDAGCSGHTALGVNLGDGCASGGTLAWSTSGNAGANMVAATQSGRADSDDVAVAVTGDAGTGSCSGAVAVSVAGDACAQGVEIAVVEAVTELLP